MNNKIFAELVKHSHNDVSKITLPYIKEKFGVEVKRCDTIEQYADTIDDACLNRYFKKYWQNDMRKWKYSGLALIDEVNNLKPRAVLDVGCGYNEFKGKIKNLIGIDPAWSNEQKKAHLAKQNNMFNNLANVAENDEERENANKMLENIAFYRKNYLS